MTNSLVALFGRVTLLVTAVAAPLLSQQESPITEHLTRGRNALNDLRYTEADSLARFVLAFGNLLTAQQRMDALHIRAAAAYPDEEGARNADSAVAIIREIVALGGTGLPPREIAWPGLDSLYKLVARAAAPARVLIGARIPGSVLYVDDAPQGVIQSLRLVNVPSGRPVKLTVRAEGCTQWDSTIVAQAADSIRIGFRNPRCSR